MRATVATTFHPELGQYMSYRLQVAGRIKAFPGLQLASHDTVTITELLDVQVTNGVIDIVITEPEPLEDAIKEAAGMEMEYPEQVPGMPFFDASGRLGYLEGIEPMVNIDADDCNNTADTREGTLRAVRRLLGQHFLDAVLALEKMATAVPNTEYTTEVDLTPDEVITFVRIVNERLQDRNVNLSTKDGDEIDDLEVRNY